MFYKNNKGNWYDLSKFTSFCVVKDSIIETFVIHATSSQDYWIEGGFETKEKAQKFLNSLMIDNLSASYNTWDDYKDI